MMEDDQGMMEDDLGAMEDGPRAMEDDLRAKEGDNGDRKISLVVLWSIFLVFDQTFL